jgi:hypothetical protein
MSTTFRQVLDLIDRGEIRVSAHGYNELSDDDITVRDVISEVEAAVIVEDYPNYSRSPLVLVLQKDRKDQPIHVVWGIQKTRIHRLF